MDAATTGIEIRDYDPAWPDRFDGEAAPIREALAPLGGRVEHIGSTAVPGLAAKPTVDMLVLVPTLADADAAVPLVQALGFRYRAEYEDVDKYGEDALPSRRLLYRGDPDRRANIHVFAAGDPEGERHLLFRDWLREHADVRDEYARLKRELSGQFDVVNDYAAAKTDFIRGVEAVAARARASEAGRAVRHGVLVGAGPREVYDLFRRPELLQTWYATDAREVPGGLVLGFDEEYGYSRQLRCSLGQEHPGELLVWRWLARQRTFDGQQVASVPGMQAGARWSDANLAGGIVVRVRLLPEAEGTRVLLEEAGYGYDDRWDHTLAEHAAWWQHYLHEALPEVAGGCPGESYTVVQPIAAPASRVWRALTSGAEQRQWLPPGVALPARPGCETALRWAGTQARATAGAVVAGRSVRLCWDAPAARGTSLRATVRTSPGTPGTRLEVEHEGWPAGGGVGRALERSRAAWAGALARLAAHLKDHPW